MWGESYENTSQNTIQLTFLVIAVLCIPLMLLPKPLYEIYCQRRRSHRGPKDQLSRKFSG